MMTIDKGILLKNRVSCNFMLKYYIPVLLRHFTKTLNQFLNLPRANENLEIDMPFYWSNGINQSSLEVLSLHNISKKGIYLKNTN